MSVDVSIPSDCSTSTLGVHSHASGWKPAWHSSTQLRQERADPMDIFYRRRKGSCDGGGQEQGVGCPTRCDHATSSRPRGPHSQKQPATHLQHIHPNLQGGHEHISTVLAAEASGNPVPSTIPSYIETFMKMARQAGGQPSSPQGAPQPTGATEAQDDDPQPPLPAPPLAPPAEPKPPAGAPPSKQEVPPPPPRAVPEQEAMQDSLPAVPRPEPTAPERQIAITLSITLS